VDESAGGRHTGGVADLISATISLRAAAPTLLDRRAQQVIPFVVVLVGYSVNTLLAPSTGRPPTRAGNWQT